MTMQMSEKLIIELPALELPELQVYGVMVGDIDSGKGAAYPFSVRGNPEKMRMCTALWRGYVSTYLLRPDGTLHLTRLEYPFTKDVQPDEVDEQLTGDFWLDLRKGFMGDAVRLPFVDGRIDMEERHWRTRKGISMGRR